MADDGDLIGRRYRRVAKLGTGAMGVVWHAKDTVLHRDVAVKQLLAFPALDDVHARQAHDRAMREGRIAAQLHHPNAITVYDMVEHDGTPCLVMEFLRARNLGDLIRDGRTLSVRETAALGRQIASALAAAHAAGIVHRDVKPGNILLTDDGTAKLTDFGIARAVGDATLTATGMVVGTPAYLAPEVARGREASWRSDVFSLGATLYAAVEGAPPFGTDENPIAQLHRVATEDITPPRKAAPLTEPLLAMLQRDPDKRPRAREIVRMLTAIADGRDTDDDAPRPLARTAILPAEPPGPAEQSGFVDPAQPAADTRPDRPARPLPSWAKPAGRKARLDKAALGGAAFAAGAGAQASAPPAAATPASAQNAGNVDPTHTTAAAKAPAPQPASARPAAEPVAASAAAPPPTPPPSDPGRIRLPGSDRPLPAWVHRRTAIVAAVVIVLLLGGILAAILVPTGSSPVVVGPPATPGTTAPHPTTNRPAPSTHGATAPAVPPPTTAVSPPQTTPSLPATTAPPSAPVAVGDPASTIVAYYGLAPSNPAVAWTWLTPGYQQSQTGGQSYYNQFWNQFQSVSVSNVTSSGTTVEATLDYHYRSGGTDHERRTFTLVQQNGRWLIAASSVIG